MSYKYARDGFGTVNLMSPEGHLQAHHDPSDQISLVIIDGSIMKHGRAESVQSYLDKVSERAKAAGFEPGDLFGDQVVLTVTAADLDDAMLDEINICLATTGRAAGLADRLTEMRLRSSSVSDPAAGC